MNKLSKLAGKKAGGNVGRSMLAASMSVAAIAASVTGAYFTDSDAGDSVVSTGNVALTTTPVAAVVSMGNMAPGDVKRGTVTVTNGGSLELRYALKSVTTEGFLAAQLDLTVWDEAAEGADTDSTCSTTVPLTVLYAPAALGATTPGVKIFGDAATGPHGGDRVLAANASEVLCFTVALPIETTSAYDSETTTATFTFDSEQTANNA